MLKSIVIASAMLVSAPVFGQVAQPSAAVPAGTQQTPTNTDPSQSAPSGQAQLPGAPTDSAPTQGAPAETAAAQPATGSQIADVIGKEFPTYDKDGDGSLTAKEFDTWMVALKTASDPSTKATAPGTKSWLTQAFAQADTDKNKKVSKGELTSFLSAAG